MRTLRLLSWNVNGLRAIFKKGFLDWLVKDSPDMLCLQETKSREDQVPPELKSIPGYHSYFTSGDQKGRGGVGLFMLFNVYFPNGKASQERLEYKLEFYDLLPGY